MPISAGWCRLVTFGGKNLIVSHAGILDISMLCAGQLSRMSIAFTSPCFLKCSGQKTLLIHQSVMFLSNHAFFCSLYGRGGAVPGSSNWKHYGFFAFPMIAFGSRVPSAAVHVIAMTRLLSFIYFVPLKFILFFSALTMNWEVSDKRDLSDQHCIDMMDQLVSPP